MRFDLEIPAITNAKLVYIPEGEMISSSLVPITYYSLNTKDMFIEDFVTAENAFMTREFLADGYEVKDGPAFDVASDKILITHIAKFSQKEGVRLPLFYKHTIHANVAADIIKIFDYFHSEVSKDEYIVETYKGKTYIYMNKTDKILFIEYVSGVGFSKSILDLQPVYQEPTWETLSINGQISDFEYIIDGDVAKTTYNGQLFVSNISNIKLFRPPLGNIDDTWFIGILNSNFKANGHKYTTPEYYRQKFDGDGNLKQIVEKKCSTVYQDVIKSQYNISRRMLDSVFVYVKNFYTGEVKYALTTNKFFVGTLHKDNVYYSAIDKVSADGYILLPMSLEENEVAYATHFTEDDFCEYTSFNLNSLIIGQNNYCAFYIKPDISDTGNGIDHKLIGDGGDFGSYEEYIGFIADNNYYHVVLISTTAYYDESFIETYDVRQNSGLIKNKYEACKKDIDLFYGELLSGNITIPTNDALIATLSTNRIVDENRFKFNEDSSAITDEISKGFLSSIKDVLNKNLDASTKSIIEVNIPI